MKKTLAASFIITVGVGCTVQNAPRDTTPQTTVEPAPAPPAPPEPVDMETPEPKTGGGDEAGLPEAGPNDQILTKKDGTCWAMPDVDCPPSPATCNPPPPTQVACPSEK